MNVMRLGNWTRTSLRLEEVVTTALASLVTTSVFKDTLLVE